MLDIENITITPYIHKSKIRGFEYVKPEEFIKKPNVSISLK